MNACGEHSFRKTIMLARKWVSLYTSLAEGYHPIMLLGRSWLTGAEIPLNHRRYCIDRGQRGELVAALLILQARGVVASSFLTWYRRSDPSQK